MQTPAGEAVNERTPVSFRSAKPVDPKTRHPFSGEVLDKSMPPLSEGEIQEAAEADAYIARTRINYTPNPYGEAIAALKRQRADIDKAIELLERLA